MIAIPNMGMPDTCDMCPIEGCEYINGKFTCPLIEIDQEDEEAVLFLARMRKAMREGKSLREFLDGERRSE